VILGTPFYVIVYRSYCTITTFKNAPIFRPILYLDQLCICTIETAHIIDQTTQANISLVYIIQAITTTKQ